MERWMDLKPNRLLLDSEFEGYRLSLDKTAGYNFQLCDELKVVNIQTHRYSLQHVKLFTSHNHLFQDRWNPNVLYFISTDNIVYCLCDLPNENSVQDAAQVFSLGDSLSTSTTKVGGEEDLYNPTLTFPSKELAILSDGSGGLHLLQTGDRTNQSAWTVLYSERKGHSFMVCDSLYIESADASTNMVCLATAHVREKEEGKGFHTIISRISLVSEEGRWREELIEEYSAYNVEYVSLDSTGSLYIASQTHNFSSSPAAGDAVSTDADPVTTTSPGAGGGSGPAYIWLQADDDITVTFSLQNCDNLSKSDVEVVYLRDSISVTVKGRQLLSGKLCNTIAPGECTWTMSDGNQRLELFISKSPPLWWSEFVVGDDRGEMVTDPDVADRIHQNLDYLTSEFMEDGKLGSRSAVTGQDLEECDMVDTESTYLCKLPPHSSKPSSITNVTGYTWLFNRPPVQGDPAQFCTRHDVDGIVWSPSTADEPPTHTTTYNALGYIQASKENRRFIACPNSHKYVVIADSDKHVYLYRQPKAIDTDMRNRKTGKSLAHVSVQQVISLDGGHSIYGLAATNEAIYILTKTRLYKYVI